MSADPGRHGRAAAAARAALAALIVLGALVGPVYGRAALASVARATVESAAPSRSGLTLSSDGDFPSAEIVDHLVPDDVRRWFEPSVHQSSVGVVLWPKGRTVPFGHLVWRAGWCEHVDLVTGRCPSAEGEVAVETSIAALHSWSPGSRLTLAELSGTWGTDEDVPIVALTVVATYRQQADARYWFDDVLPTAADGTESTPTLGALLTAPETLAMTGRTLAGNPKVFGRVEQRVDLVIAPAATGLDELLTAGPQVGRFVAAPVQRTGEEGTVRSVPGLSVRSGLPDLAAEVERGRAQILLTVPLLASALALIVAYVFWLVVLAAAQARRPWVAVARLRGQGAVGAQRLVLRTLLPSVLVGVPVGLVAVALVALAAQRWWFVPRPDLAVDRLTVAVAVVASLVPVVLLYVAAARVSREPLADLLRAVPTRERRSVSVVEAVLATLAVGGFVAVVTGGLVGPLGLAAPLLLALAGGLGASRLVLRVASRRGEAALRAGRLRAGTGLVRIGRVGLARFVVPVLSMATALVVMAAAALGGAEREYARQALADVGAPVVLDVAPVRPDLLAAAVQSADPSGQVAAPVLVVTPSDPRAVSTVATDSARFARVAEVLPEVTEQTWRSLRPDLPAPRLLRGSSLSVAVSSAGFRPHAQLVGPLRVSVALVYLDPSARPVRAPLLEVGPGAARTTVTVPLACAQGCRLVGFELTAFGLSEPPGPTGEVVFSNARLDGAPYPLGPVTDWLPSASDAASAGVQLPAASASELRVDVDFGPVERAVVHQASVPYRVPALVTAEALSTRQGGSAPVVAQSLSGSSESFLPQEPLRLVPGVGPRAVLVDLATLSGAGWVDRTTTHAHVYLAEDDASVPAFVAALQAHGVTVVGQRRAATEATAYGRSAPGWSLRLGAVLGVLALLVALAALAAVVAAGASRARRELAGLRLAGLSTDDVRAVAERELVPLVVVGTLVGALAGALAAWVTVPKLPLLAHAPAVDVTNRSPDLLVAGAVTALVLVAGVLAARALARWVARGSDPVLLREVDG